MGISCLNIFKILRWYSKHQKSADNIDISWNFVWMTPIQSWKKYLRYLRCTKGISCLPCHLWLDHSGIMFEAEWNIKGIKSFHQSMHRLILVIAFKIKILPECNKTQEETKRSVLHRGTTDSWNSSLVKELSLTFTFQELPHSFECYASDSSFIWHKNAGKQRWIYQKLILPFSFSECFMTQSLISLSAAWHGVTEILNQIIKREK